MEEHCRRSRIPNPGGDTHHSHCLEPNHMVSSTQVEIPAASPEIWWAFSCLCHLHLPYTHIYTRGKHICNIWKIKIWDKSRPCVGGERHTLSVPRPLDSPIKNLKSHWRSWAFYLADEVLKTLRSHADHPKVTKCRWRSAMAWYHLFLWSLSVMFLCS